MRNEKNDIKYLRELGRQYPDRSAVSCEIINLNAILNLPKGTEHFMSDLHGESDAFSHIRRCASGVTRRKIDLMFGDCMSESKRAELATLIYYPEEKLDELADRGVTTEEWYSSTLHRLIALCRGVGEKYTRSKVRRQLRATSAGYEAIIEELLNGDRDEQRKAEYYDNIYKTVIRTGSADKLIIAIASAIKGLVIDHLHIVGDIFDRGARADMVMDELMRERSIDIQWGNHDALWMGAGAGSRTCIATVINNSITYKNLDVIEIGYGISLRPLSTFAMEVYRDADVDGYMPKGNSGGDFLRGDDEGLIARMHKAISVIQFKLEGQTILRNPEFHMEDRLILGTLDKDVGTVVIDGKKYTLRDKFFPTVDPSDPYRLTEGEAAVMAYLKNAFMRSEKLQRHISFLFKKGEMYTVYNRNLLFHGCIPIDDSGEFMPLDVAGGRRGKALMDYLDRAVRRGYMEPVGSAERQKGKDLIWFLWCGKDSPLCARKRIATFERLLIDDEEAHSEPRNAYYKSWNDEKMAEKILNEFSLCGAHSHIINGHIPVNKGEEPIKAGGKLIVIDGGFCRAFLPKTGIGGYTLIYNADGMRISAHQPFTGRDNAIKNNEDIISDTVIFEQNSDKIRIRETDEGAVIRDRIADLMMLLHAYENGEIKERVH